MLWMARVQDVGAGGGAGWRTNSAFLFGIQHFLEPLAQQVEGQHGQHLAHGADIVLRAY